MTSGVRSLKLALMPILWLNCIFCMGIFEIPINRPRYFLSIFYVVSILVGYFILSYKGIYIFGKMFNYEFVIVLYTVLGINIIVAVVAIILFWWKSENINSIIKRNSIADNTLEALGIKKEYQKVSRTIMWIIAIWIVGVVTLNVTQVIFVYRDTGYWIALYGNVCFCFPIMVNSVVDITFASFIRCVKLKLQRINLLINNVVLCANESNVFKICDQYENMPIAIVRANYKNHKDKVMHLIQTLRHLHLEITRIGRQVNHAFCLQLLLELAVHFTVVTSTIYCLYGTFSGQLSMEVDDEKIIALTVWGSIYAFKIILLNCLCTNVSAEAYKTGEIIQSFEGSIIDDDMREEINQFTQQIVLNSLDFTAAGFFSIDNSLTGKFFATVTTYVVILIQMNTPTMTLHNT